MTTRGRLVVVTGPSGVGKSTVVQEVLRRTGARFSVSATTRSPRAGEVDGREYRFIDRGAFEALIERGELLEWAEVYGDYYGTPSAPIAEAVAADEIVILEIDVQGGLQVNAMAPDATFILIEPPSQDVLAERLGGRGSETPEAFERRLAAADEEIATARASGVYNHRVINDKLAQTVTDVMAIIQRETQIQ
ncbi:MAG: guanylate kinase [Planctomycetota bacterium]